jgi:hypothetical protein
VGADRHVGKDTQFDRLLTTRAVTWRTQDEKTFQLRPDRSELAETGDSLDGVASAILAAFRITSEELARIRAMLARRGVVPRLDLAGLSAVYRVVVLARATQLRIGALDLLLRLIPPEADPFRDPSATRRFIQIVNEVQASDFTPERLAYLFRHEWEPRRDPGPLPAQVEAVLTSIRRSLADAFAETSRPAEVTGDTLRQKLAVFLDPALVDAALEILDPWTSSTPAGRREFFDRHLSKIFLDAPAAAARLFAPPPAGASRQDLDGRWRANIDLVLEHLLPQLRTRQLRGSIVQTLGDTLGLSIPATARLLDQVLRSRERRGEPLLRDFLALLGTGLTGAYYCNNELSESRERSVPCRCRSLRQSVGSRTFVVDLPANRLGPGWKRGLMSYPPPDHTPRALQGVDPRACAGCGRPFLPTRATQVHCRPACRVLALRKRREVSVLDLLARGIAAGHVDPDVMPHAVDDCRPRESGDGHAWFADLVLRLLSTTKRFNRCYRPAERPVGR